MKSFFITIILIFISVTSNAQTDANCSQVISGKVLNKQNAEYISDATIKLFIRGEDAPIEEKTTTEDATFTFSLDCGSRYIIEVSKENFTISRKSLYTARESGEVELNIELFPIREFVEVDTNKLIDVGHVSFETDKSEIEALTLKKLDIVVDIMNKYEDIKISVEVHTDSKGDAAYSKGISKERADSVVSYLSEKGIDSSRLEAYGYGNKFLKNHCAKGVECTEVEHKENRRIEFIVIP